MTEYQSPKLTVDGVLLEQGKLLLIKRKNDPFQGMWALPGGYVEYGETTEHAIIREMQEETGLLVEIIGLLGVYSDPKRDPRGHTVTIVYNLKRSSGKLIHGDDAAEAQFFDYASLPPVAFDHHQIIENVIRRKNDVLSKM